MLKSGAKSCIGLNCAQIQTRMYMMELCVHLRDVQGVIRVICPVAFIGFQVQHPHVRLMPSFPGGPLVSPSVSRHVRQHLPSRSSCWADAADDFPPAEREVLGLIRQLALRRSHAKACVLCRGHALRDARNVSDVLCRQQQLHTLGVMSTAASLAATPQNWAPG